MNALKMEKKIAVITALLEGSSVRSTERMTGVHRDTICRLLVAVGEHCQTLLKHKLNCVSANRIQCDEIYCYVGKKEKRVAIEESDEVGEQYVFVAMDADTKLVFSWLVGKRSQVNTHLFIRDVYNRTPWGWCPQITTDGWGPYVPAINATFRDSVDYAQLVKIYGSLPAVREGYSPSRFVEAVSKVVTGNPDPMFVSTSCIERQNLTMRMAMRRFTRLTNAFSKKLGNLKAAVALHFAHYNFCRVHSSLRITPAMAAGLATEVWPLTTLLA
ncbi:MAG TPA: IS1 family transposase [Terriglobales bacterium]|nr:IS1 family transposase [Terriglobales bacterium]